jgi:hypothetical protein
MNIYYCSKCRRFKYGDGVEETKGGIMLPYTKNCVKHPEKSLSPINNDEMFISLTNAVLNVQDELRELIELKKAR